MIVPEGEKPATQDQDSRFITLNAFDQKSRLILGGKVVKGSNITKELAQQIAIELLKKRACTEKVDVSLVEQGAEIWTVRGTYPIDLEGHPWAEKFEVVLDTRGKVKSIDFALL